MNRNRIFCYTVVFFISFKVGAQGVWLDSTIYSRKQLEKPLKIFVDLNKIQHSLSDTFQGPLYMWFWRPIELDPLSPNTNGLGMYAWKNSNEVLRMQHEYDKVYSYSFTPYSFFGQQNIFGVNQFSFLVKPKDGGGYGEKDLKSEDLTIPYTTDMLYLSKKILHIKDTTKADSLLVISETPVFINAQGKTGMYTVREVERGGLMYIRAGLYYHNSGRPYVDTLYVSNWYSPIDTIYVQVDGVTSMSENVKDINLSGVKVFPNPVKDILFCEVNSGEYTLVLRDITGKKVSLMETKSSCSFDLNGFDAGIYFLTFQQSEGISHFIKVVKQ